MAFLVSIMDSSTFCQIGIKRSRSRSSVIRGSLTIGPQFNYKKTSGNNIMFSQSKLFPLSSVIISLVLLTTCLSCRSDSIQATEVGRRESDHSSASLQALDPIQHDDDAQLVNSEPRQYFKIHVVPNQQANKRHLKQGTKGIRRTIAADSQQEQPSKQKISNATLKKLLNQSLLKSTNGSAVSNSKAPNFKFVFIQRATASPSKGSNGVDTTEHGKKPINSSQRPSLAASVSKQLANSLLNSAVNIMTNLTSAPSLSSLASQIVSQSLDTQPQTDIFQSSLGSLFGGTPSVASNFSSSSSSSSSSSTSSSSPPPSMADYSQSDINRIKSTVMDKRKSTTSTIKKSSGKSKQPSKVYNLPVKFAANGQPSSLVFNTIRQHFATIKKLQSATKSSGNQQQQQGKRRKQQGNKLKGTNSRLIYLPLKYLSNARSNKIITSRATHKSS